MVDLDLFLISPEVIPDLGGVWSQNIVNTLQARLLRVEILYHMYILNMRAQRTLLILVELDLFLRSQEVIPDSQSVWPQNLVDALKARVMKVDITCRIHILNIEKAINPHDLG